MHWNRLAWVLLGMGVLAVAAFFLWKKGSSDLPWLPGCTFHRLTGFHCAGCGMTRAAHAALHGEVRQAFRYNPLGMVLLPLAVIGISLEIHSWLRVSPHRWRLNIGSKGAWAILWLVLAFWFMRNLPAWPFTLLAPPTAFLQANHWHPWPSSRTPAG